jgi:hypothetical protein
MEAIDLSKLYIVSNDVISSNTKNIIEQLKVERVITITIGILGIVIAFATLIKNKKNDKEEQFII